MKALPAVGLVVLDRALGKRTGAALKSAGFPIAFLIQEPGPDDLGRAEVVVVACGARDRARETLQHLREMEQRPRVVACFPAGEAPNVQWIVDQGIDGVVWDTRIADALDATIRAVVAGQLAVPGDLSERRTDPVLTSREKQVLSLMIMGLTNREIAEKIFVSENTVKSHLNTAYRKLGVHSRAEAMRRITDPEQGLGTGILAITAPGLKRTRGG